MSQPSTNLLAIRLRPELRITHKSDGSDRYYLVEDPIHSKFFRIGEREYGFIDLLQRHGNLELALQESPDVSPSQANSIIVWLNQSGLVTKPNNSTTRSARFNPFFIRCPLWRPDGFFTRCEPLQFLMSRVAFCLWTVVVAAALILLGQDWTRFLEQSSSVFQLSNWWLLAIVWLGLKFTHEFSHGLACKKYGGRVREAGIVLLYFTPLAYVDVSSAWKFDSKWQRVLTAAAGIYAELFVAAVATIAWSITGPGTLNHLCFNIMTMAGLMTIVFNANPLMKFDGYFMLSDALGLHNLYERGQQVVSNQLSRLFLGKPVHKTPACPTTRSLRRFIAMYGIAAAIWRVIVCLSITVAAMALCPGAEVPIAVLLCAFWLGPMAAKAWVALRAGWWRDFRQVTRFTFASGLITGVLLLLTLALPNPLQTTAPLVVRFRDTQIVRADSDGFVAKVLVSDGQPVEAGQIMVELANDELTNRFESVCVDVRQSQVRCRQLGQSHQLAEQQAERQKLQSLLSKKRELETRLESLSIRATQSGVVCAPDLHNATGTYVQAGLEMLAVGSPKRKELLLAIAEQDAEVFRASLGKEVRVRLTNGSVLQGSLASVEPRATSLPPHDALAANAGGPLAIRFNETGEPQLLTARFKAIVNLNSSIHTPVGATGIASLAPMTSLLWRALRGAHDWIRQRLRGEGV